MIVEQGGVAKGITWSGAMATAYGWFTVTEWAAIVGVTATLIGLLLQFLTWRGNRKSRIAADDRAEEERLRAIEEHNIRMEMHRIELAHLRKRQT